MKSLFPYGLASAASASPPSGVFVKFAELNNTAFSGDSLRTAYTSTALFPMSVGRAFVRTIFPGPDSSLHRSFVER